MLQRRIRIAKRAKQDVIDRLVRPAPVDIEFSDARRDERAPVVGMPWIVGPRLVADPHEFAIALDPADVAQHAEAGDAGNVAVVLVSDDLLLSFADLLTHLDCALVIDIRDDPRERPSVDADPPRHRNGLLVGRRVAGIEAGGLRRLGRDVGFSSETHFASSNRST
ncbi:MAG: hypothetical protein HZA93_13315 [Verrucomicrobia bacterium]|nr:hypothetical protein [Verrucomicrobiota bacterium]